MYGIRLTRIGFDDSPVQRFGVVQVARTMKLYRERERVFNAQLGQRFLVRIHLDSVVRSDRCLHKRSDAESRSRDDPASNDIRHDDDCGNPSRNLVSWGTASDRDGAILALFFALICVLANTVVLAIPPPPTAWRLLPSLSLLCMAS